MDSPRTPTSGSLTRKFSMGYTPRVIKRSKLPPPLDLNPLTPPPTIKKQRIHTMVGRIPLESSSALQSALETPVTATTLTLGSESPLFRYSKHPKTVNQNCSICSESMNTKLKYEKVLRLKCSHTSHYTCYLLYHESKRLGEEVSDICCTVCGETGLQPSEQIEGLSDEPLQVDKFSKLQNNGSEPHTPTMNDLRDIHAEIQLSDFKPKSGLPFTPVKQMIINSNPSGFQPSPIPDPTSYHSDPTISSPRMIDFARPTVNIISYKEGEKISNVINIFTNELQSHAMPELDDLEKEEGIKKQIHKGIVSQLQSSVLHSQQINFEGLPQLKLFDSFEVSLDGVHWELINAFIFDDVYLIMVDQRMTSIVGSIMLKEHFSSSTKLSESQLLLYFKTSTLPELNMRSMNTILISKYEEYFSNMKASTPIPLVQITTTLWSLVGTDVDIPPHIKKFNDLTSQGLELPINLLKAMVPKPQRKPIHLILVIQLFNFTNLTNRDYLVIIQATIRQTLRNLGRQDKLGLVIQGRDGARSLSVYNSSFLGMISQNWNGWDELIRELNVFKPRDEQLIDGNEAINSMLNSCNKLNSMIDGDETVVRKVIWLNNMKSDCMFHGEEVKSNLTRLFNFGVSFNHFEIAAEFTDFSKNLIDYLIRFSVSNSNGGMQVFKNYELKKFDTFGQFTSHYEDVFDKLKRVIVSNVSVHLSIPQKLTNVIKFKSFEMLPLDNTTGIQVDINGLYDGFYKNVKFELELLDPSYAKSIDILVTYKYNKNTFTYIHQLNYGSTRDTVLMKREIEMLVAEKLIAGDTKGLKQLIFENIKGCSTRYLNFFKLSEFYLCFKNFVNYIDELVKRAEDDEKRREELVIQLQLESLI